MQHTKVDVPPVYERLAAVRPNLYQVFFPDRLVAVDGRIEVHGYLSAGGRVTPTFERLVVDDDGQARPVVPFGSPSWFAELLARCYYVDARGRPRLPFVVVHDGRSATALSSRDYLHDAGTDKHCKLEDYKEFEVMTGCRGRFI